MMRHGKSDWSTGLVDFERPLARRGHDNAPEMAQWLLDADLVPDAILTSAATRALMTATHVAETVGLDVDVMDVRDDLYMASAHNWLNVLSEHQTDHRLLICGHNPGLDDLVEYLSADELRYTGDGKLMTTAAIAAFAVESWDELGHRSARLLHLMRPREL